MREANPESDCGQVKLRCLFVVQVEMQALGSGGWSSWERLGWSCKFEVKSMWWFKATRQEKIPEARVDREKVEGPGPGRAEHLRAAAPL